MARNNRSNCDTFPVCKKHAYEFRGYKAIGGEYILLLLPVIFLLIRRVAKDWLNRWRVACEEVKRDDT